MVKNKLLTLMVGVLPTFLSGCASIMDGSNQNVNFITSSGQSTNASIYTANGVRKSRIPQSMTVKKSSSDIIIRAQSNGETTETRSEAHLNNWFWGNIIFGGFFGSTTDAVTGAMWEYDDTIMVQVPEPSVSYYNSYQNRYR